MGWRENFQKIGGHPGFKDMTGQRFGILTVRSRADNDEAGNAQWNCHCNECGQSHVFRGTRLRAKAPRSCPVRKQRAA